jgi:hypothetical protein
MPKAWSAKRERQYEHVKESEKKQGRSTKRAKEIAARTVNKQRAEKGETKRSSRSGSSSSYGGQTREQLYEQAKRLGIDGRSKMNKQQLQRAVSRRK